MKEGVKTPQKSEDAGGKKKKKESFRSDHDVSLWFCPFTSSLGNSTGTQ